MMQSDTDRWAHILGSLSVRLSNAMEFEGESQEIWDHVEGNLMYGRLNKDARLEMHAKTYNATELHSDAQGTVRDVHGMLIQLASEMRGTDD